MAKVIIVKEAAEAGQLAGELFLQQIKSKSNAVLGVATGSTPLPVYEYIRQNIAAAGDLSQTTWFALDEYVGIPQDHPESYHQVIAREVKNPLGLRDDQVHVPDGTLANIATAGERYEAAITAAGGVDIQLLGIGTDGHIGFNEPGSSLGSRTRVVALTQQTLNDNARFFDSVSEVPTLSITQGVGTILAARKLVLLAYGEAKAPAIAGALEGPITALLPASAIQLHPDVTVIIDEAAASQLKLKDYYHLATRSFAELGIV